MSIFTGSRCGHCNTNERNKEVDYDKLGMLIEEQIAGSTDAIIICGTTGESSTLTNEEHLSCIQYCVQRSQDVFDYCWNRF